LGGQKETVKATTEQNIIFLSRKNYFSIFPSSSLPLYRMVPSPDSYSGAERVDDVVGVQECVRGWARLPAVVLETVFGLDFRPQCRNLPQLAARKRFTSEA
jgi:hypothetical protein